jgi:hypothetical protein
MSCGEFNAGVTDACHFNVNDAESARDTLSNCRHQWSCEVNEISCVQVLTGVVGVPPGDVEHGIEVSALQFTIVSLVDHR